MRNLLTSCLVSYTATAASTVTTEVTSTAVDTAGYDTVTFIRSTSAIRTLKVLGGATATSATTALAGATVTATAGALVKIEVHKPPYRFLALTSTEGVTSIFGDQVTILSNARDLPVTNTSYALVATPTDA